jgi:hypothetical protein
MEVNLQKLIWIHIQCERSIRGFYSCDFADTSNLWKFVSNSTYCLDILQWVRELMFTFEERGEKGWGWRGCLAFLLPRCGLCGWRTSQGCRQGWTRLLFVCDNLNRKREKQVGQVLLKDTRETERDPDSNPEPPAPKSGTLPLHCSPRFKGYWEYGFVSIVFIFRQGTLGPMTWCPITLRWNGNLKKLTSTLFPSEIIESWVSSDSE